MVRIVGIGGGTGLPILLRGLRELSENKRAGFSGPDAKVSAIVCVSDNGGSSGALRRDFGIPAVGDLRNCLAALAEENHLLPELFQYRFGPGSKLDGHPLGNLMLTALCQMTGSLSQACELASEMLRLKGVVLPATDAAVTLCAEFENGERACGELQTSAARQKIRRVWLEQPEPPPAPGVLETIAAADAIVFGPGSLFTSIVPPLMVAGVAEALNQSRALKIFITNLMTQPGETDGFSASDHLRVMQDYLGPHCVDVCVVNSRPVDWSVRRKYVEAGAEPVYADQERVARLGAAPIRANVFMEGQLKARHDPAKLARLVMSLAEGALRARDFVCGPADFAA
jgi:uncharacterized cofD-like protein